MATLKQKKAFDKTVENGGNVSRAMLDTGYSPATAKTPQKLTESLGWKELLEEFLPDTDLARKHKELLNSTRVDHLVFPLGPATKKDLQKYIQNEEEKAKKAKREYVPTEYLTDDDIKEMLLEVNCKVRRIVHGETARHVYFWSADNKALKEGLDMAYKLKGSYAPEKTAALNLNIKGDIKEFSALEAVRLEYEEKLKKQYLK